MNHKLEEDKRSGVMIDAMGLKSERRREQLEKRLEELENRNVQRISELKHIQENVLNKINEDIRRNEKKERSLKQEYERIKKEEKKVGKVN